MTEKILRANGLGLVGTSQDILSQLEKAFERNGQKLDDDKFDKEDTTPVNTVLPLNEIQHTQLPNSYWHERIVTKKVRRKREPVVIFEPTVEIDAKQVFDTQHKIAADALAKIALESLAYSNAIETVVEDLSSQDDAFSDIRIDSSLAGQAISFYAFKKLCAHLGITDEQAFALFMNRKQK